MPRLVVLLEPDTEGRLAGCLARHGEGWAATWSTRRPTQRRTGRSGTGPLGRERLADREAAGRGPFRLLLPAATIEP